MPKKTRGFQDREFSLKCYFRWEFIRRNSSYRSDYGFFVGKFGPWFEDRGVNLGGIHGYDIPFWDDFLNSVGPEAECYFTDEILVCVQAFLHKWGVAWPCVPDFSFERDCLAAKSHTDKTLRATFRNTPIVELRPHLQSNLDVRSSMAEPKEWELTEIEELARKVDQDCQEKPEAYFQVLRRLGYHRSLTRTDWVRISSDLTPKVSSRNRLRLEVYDQYLQVWDFKTTLPHATWPEVARALYSDYPDYKHQTAPGDTNPAVQRAKYRYQRAMELISGGFVEIR